MRETCWRQRHWWLAHLHREWKRRNKLSLRVGHRPGADPRLDESEGRHAYLVMAGLVPAIYARLIGSPPLRQCVDGWDKPGHDGPFLARREATQQTPA
jgi:hypothetical protein